LGKSKWVVEARQLPYTVSIAAALLVATLVLCLVPGDFELEGKGKLQPVTRREVFANTEGDVIEVLVNHGDTVKRGQLLASLNIVELKVKLAGTQGQLDSAEASLTSTQNALATSRKADERSRLQADVLKYRSQADSYRAQLKLYEYKKELLEVRSPIDGQ